MKLSPRSFASPFAALFVLASLAAGCDSSSSDANAGGSGSGEGGSDVGVDGSGEVGSDAANDAADGSGSGAADASGDAGPDEAAEVAAAFDGSGVLEVVINLPEADWDTLRAEGRTGLNQFGADCLDAPEPSPYNWQEATVSLDGAPFERVGLRKKGFFGSLDTERPSLLLDLDRNIDNQSWHTLERLTLNNNKQDDSALRTCLAFDLFRAAGVPASRCSYAHVTVNGRDLGLYTHVEAIRKSFLRLRFGDDNGWLYEGALSDFREPYDGTLEQKTNESVPYRAPIERLMAAAAVPDDQLLAALEAQMDLDGFYRFWAAEVLTAHWDGYTGDTNNFYVYAAEGDERLRFIPWGPDSTFRDTYLLFEEAYAPPSVFATGVIARRLYLHPEAQARYRSELRSLLDTIWNEEALTAKVASAAARIAPYLTAEQAALQADDQAQLLAFIGGQRAAITAELDATAPTWDYDLRESYCLTPAGQIVGTFATTLGTMDVPDAFAAGTGTVAGSFDGQPIAPEAIGAIAGIDGTDFIISMPMITGGSSVNFLYLTLPIAAIPAPGEPIPSDNGITAIWGFYDPVTETSDFLSLGYRGNLTFTSAAQQDGDAVTGSFRFEFWR
jgi:hypothetical protein